MQSKCFIITGESLFFIGFFGSTVCVNHAVGKPEDKSAADKDNEIGREKGHDKDKRVFEIIGRYEQYDTVIQEKGSY